MPRSAARTAPVAWTVPVFRSRSAFSSARGLTRRCVDQVDGEAEQPLLFGTRPLTAVGVVAAGEPGAMGDERGEPASRVKRRVGRKRRTGTECPAMDAAAEDHVTPGAGGPIPEPGVAARIWMLWHHDVHGTYLSRRSRVRCLMRLS